MKRKQRKRDYRISLRNILDAIEKIEEITHGLELEDFKKAEQTVMSVQLLLAIIGEAARNIPAEVKLRHPNIPWKRLVQMRNFIIHVYWGVNIEILWRNTKVELPALKPIMAEIIKKETQP